MVWVAILPITLLRQSGEMLRRICSIIFDPTRTQVRCLPSTMVIKAGLEKIRVFRLRHMSRKEFSEGKQNMMQIHPFTRVIPGSVSLLVSVCVHSYSLSCSLLSSVLPFFISANTNRVSIKATDGATCWFTLMTRHTWILHPRM